MFDAMSSIKDALRKMYSDESAQGITEYGAMLAFVTFLIICVATMYKGGALPTSISNSYSSANGALNAINSAADSGT